MMPRMIKPTEPAARRIRLFDPEGVNDGITTVRPAPIGSDQIVRISR